MHSYFKYVIYLSVFLIISSCSNDSDSNDWEKELMETYQKNQPKNDLERQQLNGKVFSITETYLGDPFYQERSHDTVYTIFNEAGNIESCQYVGTKVPYYYAYKTNYSEEYLYNFQDINRQIYRYDTLGNKISYWMKNYDKENRILDEIEKKYASDSMMRKVVYEYDKKDRVTSVLNYEIKNGVELLSRHVHYDYDAEGRIMEERIFERDGLDPTERIKYRYYDNGLVSDLIQYYGDSNKTHFTIRYDDRNNVKSKVKVLDNGTDPVYTITYKYDLQGNWIERTQIRPNEGSKFMTIREISYYE